MVDFHHVINREKPLDNTINLKELVGKRVISSGGKIIGKVSEVRIDPHTLKLEGIIVSQGFMSKPLYIGKGYFKTLSIESIVLNVELSLFLKDKMVLQSNGKPIGKVSRVVRVGQTNNVKEIIVNKIFRKPIIIPFSAIKLTGNSIILKPGYNVRTKYFWQKS